MKIRVNVLQIFDNIELIVYINMFDFYFVDSYRVNSNAYRDQFDYSSYDLRFFLQRIFNFLEFRLYFQIVIVQSSYFSNFFICNVFIIFLMIMIFKIFRSTLSTIKIVNSRTCFIVLRLIDLFAIIDLITNSKTIRRIFV
jgi:hypothetical protein